MCIENREEWCGACAQREGEHALKEVSTKGASSLQYVEKGGGIILIFVKKQSQELTRVNSDRNIFSINVELTSTFLLYRGLVHQHH